LFLIPTGYREGVVGTTKLTRKEIAADPIHDALIRTVEILRAHARIIILAGAGVALLLVGIYLGLHYLDTRDSSAQQELAKGMDYYHGMVDAANAKDDPYAFGPTPVFRSEEAKFRAASPMFSSLVSRYGSSKIGVIARYYLALCQKHLGQKSEAFASLEAVINNTSDRTVGYLAKKVFASYYVETGDAKKGQEVLQALLKDPQCDLPKEDLQVDLSRAYMAQGKRAEALKVLQDAQEAGGGGNLQSLIFQEMARIQSSSGNGPRP
jgi:predicted negative regulator of RcsB-dependent stress response